MALEGTLAANSQAICPSVDFRDRHPSSAALRPLARSKLCQFMLGSDEATRVPERGRHGNEGIGQCSIHQSLRWTEDDLQVDRLLCTARGLYPEPLSSLIPLPSGLRCFEFLVAPQRIERMTLLLDGYHRRA